MRGTHTYRLAVPSQAPARQVSLLRLLLLALALAVIVPGEWSVGAEGVQRSLRWLMAGVAVLTALLTLAVPWTTRPWQLILHLVFDLMWIGMLVYGTGGVASPAVVLLFAIGLVANLVLPGTVPFLIPALAALILAAQGALYLGGLHPFSPPYLEQRPALIDPPRVIGWLMVQVGALFTVDLLAQLLARRLREERIFVHQVLDQLSEGVLAVDRQGYAVYLNAELVRLFDLPVAQVGLPVARLLAGDGVAAVRALLAGPCPAEQGWDGPGGRQLILRTAPLIGRRGQRLGRTLVAADESRLRLLEDNARRAEHLAQLGAMAAGIAHEVRNPLTGLRGCAQELADITAASGQPDAAELARILIGEADRLARIIDDFLSLSRLRDPQPVPVVVESLFTDLAALVRGRRDLPDGLVPVWRSYPGLARLDADQDQVKQVFMNLINNAVDALRGVSGPRLVIEARPSPEDGPLPGGVLITVTDNGVGIPADLHERVFTPFFSTKAQGTGLGLSLVGRIVRAHGGVLALESAPGHGTAWSIHWPAAATPRR